MLSFTRSGGFSGMTTKISLDPTKLSEEKTTKLNELLSKVFPYKAPEKKADKKILDGFTYELSVGDKAKTEVLSVSDDDATEDMLNLFDFVLENDA